MSKLNGNVVLVTGGSRGIGADICRKLATENACLVINYARSEEKAEEVLAECKQLGACSKSFTIGFDVASEEQVNESIARIGEQVGAVDVLVNNAGIADDTLLLKVTQDRWDKILNVNSRGAMFTSKAVLKPMMKKRKGAIVNISSIVGEMGNAGQTVYSASKAALIGFSKSLALEVASRNIRVNVVTPGFIETEMTEILNEGLKEQFLSKIPLGRFGKAQEVASLVSFLACDDSSYITGQVFGVNGGMRM